MSRENIGKLMDRWINEPSFREELRADAEGVVSKCGLELDEDELVVLKSIDWSLSDEELQQRANKMPIV